MLNYNTEHMSIQRMRAGFTMIELIFVILLIAILGSIALGKLSATRDDAQLSACVANMATCITDVGAHYVATGIDYTETDHPDACSPENIKCYDITYAINGKDFNVTMNTTSEGFCTDIENVGGHLAKNYNFGGSSVTRY